MESAKTFTPKEAQLMLPLIKKIVEDILSTGHKVRALCAKIGTGAEGDPEVMRYMEQLEDLFVELEDLGCS